MAGIGDRVSVLMVLMFGRLLSLGFGWLLATTFVVLTISNAIAFTPAEAKAPMSVTLVRADAPACGADCPEWLALTGAINAGTPALLRAALVRLGRRSVPVLIDSPGGNVDAGIAMGRMIRDRKLAVIVAGTAVTACTKDDGLCLARLRAGEKPGFVAGGIAACASSCVLVLAGGTTRSVGANSFVGVHQMVVRKTMNRVYNLYRVMRRRVGDRLIEVSRTLISSRPVSSKTTVNAAPETLYSEVDRYLIGMGIGESIMPLMRSAPPSGIHWMLPYELASTRIATDTADARSTVMRAVDQKTAAVLLPAPRASSSIDGVSRAALVRPDPSKASEEPDDGLVTWRLDDPTAAGSTSALVADVDVPAHHFKGRLTITPNDSPGAGSSLIVHIDFASAAVAAIGQEPASGIGFREQRTADNRPVPSDVRRSSGSTTIVVERDHRASVLDGFKTQSWFYVPLYVETQGPRVLLLNLNGGGRAVIDAWLTHADMPKAPPAPPSGPIVQTGRPPASQVVEAPLPNGPSHPPGSATIEDAAELTMGTGSGSGTMIRYVGTATWTLLASPGKPGWPGTSNLLSTVKIPIAGVRASLSVGIAERSDMRGDANLEVRVDADDHRVIGPITSLTQVPVPLGNGRFGLSPDIVAPNTSSSYSAFVPVTASGPVGNEFRIVLGDASGRFATLSLPLSDAVKDLLRADAHAGEAAAE